MMDDRDREFCATVAGAIMAGVDGVDSITIAEQTLRDPGHCFKITGVAPFENYVAYVETDWHEMPTERLKQKAEALEAQLAESEARYAREWQAFDDKRTDLKAKCGEAQREAERLRGLLAQLHRWKYKVPSSVEGDAFLDAAFACVEPRRPLPEPIGPGPMPPLPDMQRVGYDVFSWSPDPEPGRTPPTAVVVMLIIDDEPKVGLRLKSRRAVDQLVDTLERHTVDVWGLR